MGKQCQKFTLAKIRSESQSYCGRADAYLKVKVAKKKKEGTIMTGEGVLVFVGALHCIVGGIACQNWVRRK